MKVALINNFKGVISSVTPKKSDPDFLVVTITLTDFPLLINTHYEGITDGSNGPLSIDHLNPSYIEKYSFLHGDSLGYITNYFGKINIPLTFFTVNDQKEEDKRCYYPAKYVNITKDSETLIVSVTVEISQSLFNEFNTYSPDGLLAEGTLVEQRVTSELFKDAFLKADWDYIKNKPRTFTPSIHEHSTNDLTNFKIGTKLAIDDLKELDTDGIYAFENGGINAPTSDPYKVLNLLGDTQSWKHQIAMKAYSTDTYIISQKSSDNSTWLDWRKIVTSTINGYITPDSTSTRDQGMYGVYDATKIDHVWSMGIPYRIPANGSDFGNLYGIAYKHSNNTTGGTMANGHQIVFVENGVPGVSIGLGGNIWCKGQFMGSGAGLTDVPFTSITVPTSYNTIGTYMLAINVGSTAAIAANGTVAGSDLNGCNGDGTIKTGALVGTWRNMSAEINGSAHTVTASKIGLFLRIA